MVHGSFAKKEAALRDQLAAAEQQAAHWQATSSHRSSGCWCASSYPLAANAGGLMQCKATSQGDDL
jgi:hypothetical protein